MIELKHSCIGVRCSVCGKSVIEYINRFQFSSGTTVTCRDCGAPLFTIKKGSSNNLLVNCFACGETHTFSLSAKSFFSGKPFSYGCKVNDIDIFFAGDLETVNCALLSLSDHMKILTDKYYENLEKVYGSHKSAALRILEEKAREKRIICLCGNYELNIKIKEHGIELICPNCDCSEFIPVASDEDVKALLERRSILIK